MHFIFLTDTFFRDHLDCPEIEQKADRPYIMLCVRIKGNLFAVPLRSHIKHKYVLWTDQDSGCGVDFTKAVLLRKKSYISDVRPHIRQNEFDALRGKEHLVAQKMEQYIRTYKKAKSRIDVPRNKLICEYSTLQYFEDYI